MNTPRILGALLATTFVACAQPPSPSDTAIDDGTLDEEISDEASTTGYFVARPDFRRCAFPFCGGFWVHRANQATTTCPGGAGAAAECYVAEIDASNIGDDINVHQFSLVRGRFSTRRFANGSRMAVMNASELWSAATDATASGTFYALEDNGLECFAAPCFSIEASRLNSSARPTALSSLDLTGAAATADQEAAAQAALVDARLIAAGVTANIPNAGPAGRGRVLRATQFFQRYEHNPNSCTSDDQCGWSSHVRPVTSSADCYCPGCPVPMAESVSDANAASWGQFCGHLRCQGPRCAPLTPAICEAQGAQGVCGRE